MILGQAESKLIIADRWRTSSFIACGMMSNLVHAFIGGLHPTWCPRRQLNKMGCWQARKDRSSFRL